MGAEIADQILLTHQVMDHWDTVLPEGRILRVPYEVLVTDQEAMTRRILDFVGLAWEPGVLRFHETARAVQTASLGQVGAYAALVAESLVPACKAAEQNARCSRWHMCMR